MYLVSYSPPGNQACASALNSPQLGGSDPVAKLGVCGGGGGEGEGHTQREGRIDTGRGRRDTQSEGKVDTGASHVCCVSYGAPVGVHG
jgi:hypothetical protein